MADPTVVAAAIGAGAALLTSLPVAYLGHRLAVKKFQADTLLGQRIRAVLVAMMNSDKWDARSLEHMKTVLTGIDENEIRKALIEIGAVCVGTSNDRELWRLLQDDQTRPLGFLESC